MTQLTEESLDTLTENILSIEKCSAIFLNAEAIGLTALGSFLYHKKHLEVLHLPKTELAQQKSKHTWIVIITVKFH